MTGPREPLTPVELARITGDWAAIGREPPSQERRREGWSLLVAFVLGAFVAACVMAGAGWLA